MTTPTRPATSPIGSAVGASAKPRSFILGWTLEGERDRGFADSPLEEGGFELSVPSEGNTFRECLRSTSPVVIEGGKVILRKLGHPREPIIPK
jgi:hypothetical protein